MSHFSRGILLNLSLSIAFIAPVTCMVALSSMAGIVAAIILSFVIMRALAIPLESLLYKRHKKTLNKIQVGLMLVVLCIQIIVIVIGSWIDSENSDDLSISVLAFLLIEFILYELFIHIFHVKLARNLVKNPSKLSKSRFSSKYFMNPIVYESINDS
jgi:Na+/H+ antiporter NhaC